MQCDRLIIYLKVRAITRHLLFTLTSLISWRKLFGLVLSVSGQFRVMMSNHMGLVQFTCWIDLTHKNWKHMGAYIAL